MSNIVEVRLPVLHPGQQRVLNEAARFNVLRAGRRFGKSTLGRHALMHEALKFRPAAWIAPSYKYLLPNWREVCDTLAPVIVNKSEEEKHLCIAGGGEIDFWSAEGGMPAEGRKYGLVVFDECAMLGAELERLWTRSVRPTLADLQGSAWFLSTSKAASSYFTTMYSWGQGERPEWKSWQLGTCENPFIPSQEIEAARQDMPAAAFAQEFLGDAVSFSGTVFPNLEKAIIDQPLPEAYSQWHRPSIFDYSPMEFFIGCDWAGAGRRASGDFTTFVVVATDGTVCAIERFKADFAMQRARLQALCTRFRPAAVLAESNSIGSVQLEAARREGLVIAGFTTTAVTKAKAVELLAAGFDAGEVKLFDIENRAALLAELMAFEATPLQNGLTRYAAPPGSHDDLVIAMLLAWNAARKPSYVGFVGPQSGSDAISNFLLGGGRRF